MLKRYTYRAYPTLDQKEVLAKTFGCARVVYNKYVENNLEIGKYLSYTHASRNLTELKQDPEYAWLNEVSAIALQQSVRDAHRAVQNYFKNRKHYGKPKFKKRSNRQSFRIVGATAFNIRMLNKKWASVLIPKAGYVKFRLARELPSKPTSVSVIQERNGEYSLSFVVDTTPMSLPKASHHTVAIDMGLTTYATTVNTDGEQAKVENPRWYRTHEPKLARLSRAKDKKQKGSKNREKARLKVARHQRHTARQRKDFIDKLVLEMVRENQTIITENLKIANLVRNNKVSKSITDAGWDLFMTALSGKCVETGREHIRAHMYYPSTKTCSTCGTVRRKVSLQHREWDCVKCGAHHDRDVNACINLLAVGSPESLNAYREAVSRSRQPQGIRAVAASKK